VPERIPIGSDHAGYQLKERIKKRLRELGFDVEDVGTDSEESTDYPDFAKKVASVVSSGEVKRGVLMCGTGLGMAYAANRYDAVRAAVAWNPEIARLSRTHNDANVLVLPARFVGDEEALEILDAWLKAEFEGGRHARRVAKIERER
jgi:ribose 5-phosphate isomerase B